MCLPQPVESNLRELRREIDVLDSALDDLLLRRIRLGRQAREARRGDPTDPCREAEILMGVARRSESTTVRSFLTRFHRTLFDCSKEAPHE